MRILFWLYILCNTSGLFFGIIYLFKLKLMPYHEEAIKKKWNEVQPEFQILFRAFVAAVGTGFINSALLNYSILFIPFKRGEFWAILTVPAIGLIGALGGLLTAHYVHKKTGAMTPRLPFAITMAVYLMGLIFSLIQ